MDNKLSREANEKIEKMVVRVARNAGYTGKEDMTYKEILQQKVEQQRKKIEKKIDKYRNKFSNKPSNKDFAEEIRTYLQDGLSDLMNEGYSEQDAIRITLEKFDEAEINENFDDFVKAFQGFGMEEYIVETNQWYAKNGEAIGLFYAAFLMLGLVGGGLIGYFFGHSLLNILIGIGAGCLVGVVLGLFSHAIIALRKSK